MMPARVCLGLVVRHDDTRRVLLGRKKYGFGEGKIVAPGGHVEPGETSRDAVVREVFEETGLRLDPETVRLVGRIEFVFPSRPEWNLTTSVHMADHVDGEPTPSDEMDAEWFPVDSPPLSRMWDDARYWLARALAGERFDAVFTFAADDETVVDARVTPR